MFKFLINLFKPQRKYKKENKNEEKNIVNEVIAELRDIKGIEIIPIGKGDFSISIDTSVTDITPDMIVKMVKRKMERRNDD